MPDQPAACTVLTSCPVNSAERARGRFSSSRTRTGQNGIPSQIERGERLLLRDRRELIEKLVERLSSFQVVEQCLNRHPRAAEDRHAPRDFRVAVDDRERINHATIIRYRGIDASICQDTRSGGLDDLLASAESGHDALVDLASEETFQAPDDLSLGSAVRRAACDVITGRLMVPHADDDGSIEGGGGVSVAASMEAVPAGGPPGRGRDWTRAAERREGGV